MFQNGLFLGAIPLPLLLIPFGLAVAGWFVTHAWWGPLVGLALGFVLITGIFVAIFSRWGKA